MRIHILGVCGTFMGGIAAIAKEAGHDVSGADQNVYAPMSTQLAALGVRIVDGYDAPIDSGVDSVVVGNTMSRGKPVVEALLDSGRPYASGPQWLAEHVLRDKWVLAVAGTHGKTTTTSLVASVLAAGGLDPTFVIGGRLNAAGANARLGTGEFIVVEADESDASFLNLMPVIAVVTNIDNDHMETYGHDFARLKQAFVEFLSRLPFYGRAVLCVDDKHVREIMPFVSKPVLTYGFGDDAQFRAVDASACGTTMRFTALREANGTPPLEVTLNLPGRHNVLNALAAIAVGTELNVPDAAILEALQSFTGVGRRFARHGEIAIEGGSFTLIDDYGHHPVEMTATLAAARGAYPGRRLVLAFQPHRYTRTRDCFEDFVKVLSTVDALLLAEVYAAGEAPIVAADGRALARALRVAGKVEPIFVESVDEMPAAIRAAVRPGDVVITMGAGSIGTVPAKLLERAR
jgi:UDP-N-acetylmuramate--alanine ligase